MSRAAAVQPIAAACASAVSTLAAAQGRVFLGAVLHVRHQGEVVNETALGVVRPDGARVRPDSPFDLASVTKIFVTTAMLALFDRRLFALEDPVVSVLPEFDGPDVRRASITFRQLLTHSSGLPAHVNVRDETSKAAVIERVCATPLAYTPGASVVYSDLGYMLAGIAVERLFGKALDIAVHELVCAPLALPYVCYRPPADQRERIVCTERDSWRGRLLQGEVHDENCWSMGGIAGHAGLFATAAEVAELAEAYRGGGAVDGARVISRHASVLATSECMRAQDERRGLGWALKTAARQSCGSLFSADSFGHTGYTGTSVWVDPRRGLTVVLLTDRVYFTRDPVPIFDLRAAVHDAIAEGIDPGAQA
jgi:CubicO group peptidase (beta-lactamase class C family)